MGSNVEEWRDIDGYVGLYQVSNIGNVRSVKRNSNLALINRNGYKKVALITNGIRKDCPAHRLVCLAFLPNPENKAFVNHKNGIRDDNRVENLEWCTPKENTAHAYTVLGRKFASGYSVYTTRRAVVKKDINGEIVETFSSIKEAASNHNGARANICRCCRGGIKAYKGFIYEYIN